MSDKKRPMRLEYVPENDAFTATSDDRQALIDAMAKARYLIAWGGPESASTWETACEDVRESWQGTTAAMLDALLAVPVPLLREIAAATKPCETCGQFAGSIHEGQMPGHVYGSNWDWVPCQTCHGSGRVPAVDRAALLAALGMEQVGWGARMKQYDDDDGTTGWFLDQTRTKLLAEYVPVWAARVSEETP